MIPVYASKTDTRVIYIHRSYYSEFVRWHVLQRYPNTTLKVLTLHRPSQKMLNFSICLHHHDFKVQSNNEATETFFKENLIENVMDFMTTELDLTMTVLKLYNGVTRIDIITTKTLKENIVNQKLYHNIIERVGYLQPRVSRNTGMSLRELLRSTYPNCICKVNEPPPETQEPGPQEMDSGPQEPGAQDSQEMESETEEWIFETQGLGLEIIGSILETYESQIIDLIPMVAPEPMTDSYI